MPLTLGMLKPSGAPAIISPRIMASANTTIASGSSHTVTLPAGYQAGDLLVVIIASASQATFKVPTGWSTQAGSGQVISGFPAKYLYHWVTTKIATGSEGATMTFSTVDGSGAAMSVTSLAKSLRITNNRPNNVRGATGDWQMFVTNFSSGQPNNPSVTNPFPTGTHLWVNVAVWPGTTNAVVAYPAGMSLWNEAVAGSSVSLAVAAAEIANAASFDAPPWQMTSVPSYSSTSMLIFRQK